MFLARCLLAAFVSLLWLSGSVWLCGSPWGGGTAYGESPPNILIITADNLGYGDLPSFNEKSPIFAPNLDRLASQGATLTSFYTASPTCTISRACLLTGRPTERGFDEFFGHASGNIDYYTHVYNGKHDMFRGTEEAHVEGYSTDLFADGAIDFIKRSSDEGDPWFVYLPFNAPHFPNARNKAEGVPTTRSSSSIPTMALSCFKEKAKRCRRTRRCGMAG